MDALQLLVAGVAMGAVYALIAFGLALVWNAAGTVNFAQGQQTVIGGFLGYTLVSKLDLWYPAALVLVVLAGGVVGMVIELITIRPLFRRLDPITFVVSTVGTAFALDGIVRTVWGTQPRTFPGMSGNGTVQIGGLVLSSQSLWIIGVVTVLMVVMHWFFSSTIYGRALRAVAVDRETASQSGVPIGRAVSVTFGMNGALAALAGFLVTPVLFVSAQGGMAILLSAFAAAVLGGFGSLTGAVIGGVLLGVVQQLTSAYVTTTYSGAVTLGLLVLILLVRPEGLRKVSA